MNAAWRLDRYNGTEDLPTGSRRQDSDPGTAHRLEDAVRTLDKLQRRSPTAVGTRGAGPRAAETRPQIPRPEPAHQASDRGNSRNPRVTHCGGAAASRGESLPTTRGKGSYCEPTCEQQRRRKSVLRQETASGSRSWGRSCFRDSVHRSSHSSGTWTFHTRSEGLVAHRLSLGETPLTPPQGGQRGRSREGGAARTVSRTPAKRVRKASAPPTPHETHPCSAHAGVR